MLILELICDWEATNGGHAVLSDSVDTVFDLQSQSDCLSSLHGVHNINFLFSLINFLTWVIPP